MAQGVRKFPVARSRKLKKKPFPGRNILCFCANDRSSCVDLSWVAKRWISCVDLRANMMSTKVSARHPNSMHIHSRPGQMESQVDPSFNCLAFQYLQVSLGRALRRWTMLQADLNLIVEYCWLLLFRSLYFRYSYVATSNGQQRDFCGLKEPFAFLVSGSYAHVSVDGYRYYQTTLKAFYVVMNNGKLSVTLIN